MQMESRGNEPRRTRYYQCLMDEQATKLDAETRRNFMDFEYTRRLDRIDSEKKGRREERLENYASLVRDGLLPLTTAMERSKLSEAEIKLWISRHPS